MTDVVLLEPRVVRVEEPVRAVVALYRADEEPQPRVSLDSKLEPLKRLGLEGQAVRVQAEANLKFARVLYQELVGYELRVWQSYLPTTYIQPADQGRRWNDYTWQAWSDYQFDTIPAPVLAEIELAQSLDCFWKLAIWSPETPRLAPHQDPMALGIIQVGDILHYFPIARWAESLISTHEAEKAVLERHGTRKKHCGQRRVIENPRGRGWRLCLPCGAQL